MKHRKPSVPTAFADALALAGVQTAVARLYTEATSALKAHHGNVAAAAPKFAAVVKIDEHLLNALAADYLTKVAADMAAGKQPPAADDRLPSRLPATAHEHHSRRREGPHQKVRRKVPTDAQKAGALRAGKFIADAVLDYQMRGGRKLGDVKMHELRAIAEQQASTASSFLIRGYDDAVESILCRSLMDHTIPPDPHAAVRDVYKAEVVAEFFKQAKIRAAEVIRDGSALVASNLIKAGQIEAQS